MKNLILIAFTILSVSAFATESKTLNNVDSQRLMRALIAAKAKSNTPKLSRTVNIDVKNVSCLQHVGAPEEKPVTCTFTDVNSKGKVRKTEGMFMTMKHIPSAAETIAEVLMANGDRVQGKDGVQFEAFEITCGAGGFLGTPLCTIQK